MGHSQMLKEKSISYKKDSFREYIWKDIGLKLINFCSEIAENCRVDFSSSFDLCDSLLMDLAAAAAEAASYCA